MQANQKIPSRPAASGAPARPAAAELWTELRDWDRQAIWSTRRLRCALLVPSRAKR